MPITQMTIVPYGPVRVEYDIRPPMSISVTLPMNIDNDRNWVVYVSYNAFTASEPSDLRVADVAKEIRRRLANE